MLQQAIASLFNHKERTENTEGETRLDIRGFL